MLTEASRRLFARSATSHPRTNGCSTIFSSPRNRFARSVTIFRADSIVDYRSLLTARSQGYPRVFGLAWAFVAHTDSRVDRGMLIRFVTAYQRVQPLTIGELWAVAIALRIVLIENLRRAADEIVNARAARAEADALADELLGVGGREAMSPKAALLRFNSMPLAAPFVVRLLERLRDQDPRVTPAVAWLDERLATKADILRRHRSSGTSAAGRDQRHRPQHHHEHASRIDARFGEDLREHESRRCRAARARRIRGNGLPNSRSLSACDRRAGARIGPLGTRSRAARDWRDATGNTNPTAANDAAARSRTRTRLLPHRERTPRAREGDRISRVRSSNWLVRAGTRAGIVGYVGGDRVSLLAIILALPLYRPRGVRVSADGSSFVFALSWPGSGIGPGGRDHQPRRHQRS